MECLNRSFSFRGNESLDDLRTAYERSKEIDEALAKDKKLAKNEVKILMLGAGETGKSTFIKQMRIIHGSGYDETARKDFIKTIHANILESICTLVEYMEKFEIKYSDDKNLERAVIVQTKNHGGSEMLDDSVWDAIIALWNDAGVQECFDRKREYQISDSTTYFMNELGRIREADFLPSVQDILRIQTRTTGVAESNFMLNGINFRMIDVGGQRSERRKWIHCFEHVTAIIFLMALSEYDQSLRENSAFNRLVESNELFKTILDYNWFLKTSIILFLNKKDLFEEKIQSSRLADYFPEYTGPENDAESGKKFILDMFQALNTNKERKIYSHFTCATDTENIRFVFSSVKDIILQANLHQVNLF